jgi:hypothetical protein
MQTRTSYRQRQPEERMTVRASGFAGVEQDAGGRFPIAGRAGPAFRVVGLGGLVEGIALGEQVAVFAAVALGRSDELQGTVAVRLVVPVGELGDPGAGLLDAGEGLVEPLRGDPRCGWMRRAL